MANKQAQGRKPATPEQRQAKREADLRRYREGGFGSDLAVSMDTGISVAALRNQRSWGCLKGGLPPIPFHKGGVRCLYRKSEVDLAIENRVVPGMVGERVA